MGSRTPLIHRLAAFASRDDGQEELERARRAAEDGDDSWAQWIDEHEAGRAVVARLVIRVEIKREDGRVKRLDLGDRGIWLERRAHPPALEAQIAEVANMDAEGIAVAAREHGIALGSHELSEMYFHVELAGDLLEWVEQTESIVGPSSAQVGHTSP